METLHVEALFGKLVREINTKLNEGLEYEKILDFIFDSLGLIIPYDRIGIALIDENAQTINLSWVRSKIPITYLKKKYSAPWKGGSLEKILRTGEPRIINDLLAYAKDHPQSESTCLILKDGIRSSLTCPLMSNSKVIGIVFFSSYTANIYDHKHIDIFSGIADQLSVVVEHGRLQNFFSDTMSQMNALPKILHDLRSPLGIIQGYLDLTIDESWYPTIQAEAKETFEILRRNTQYMFTLLEDLTQLNQIKAQQELHVVDVNTAEFCHEMVLDGQEMSRQKEITFQASIINLPLGAQFDPEKLHRVLDNLFSNAVKFSKRHTTIHFNVQGTDDRLTFSVSDEGQGIPEAELPKLFHEFGQTSTRPTEGENSTGLGLVIARKIVEYHGGEISIESKPGQGSTFSFWVPIRSAQE